ncbi:CTD small phosphatase-like protein 2 isoform X1 [Tripterygium wilfordii]|uniref:CTD small phosphatase-like protein 2 isoform X1 n=1 Tax=Tripterygium wilfordii TaxID=458696 RepID=A0A7J7D497_TRIWF|nr:CTD small phosphatase-like protein 2 [Tripterygium wilfordii]XP_038713546.1 CTD small phosphatase-like protein 2 [Tripterygium wilfordii]XP_038713547.1 CTD small phosphatase-like protein 2 [Tripterygium wilfordii]KAF5741162.1 CTD small phosphatase-like protein 2 isoform X1 [Tripterygium wilfordii]
MQTKKRITGRNSSREVASPRVSRAQKKPSENAQVAEQKVTELITSSSRRQRCVTRSAVPVAASNSNTRYDLPQDETSDTCVAHDEIAGPSMAGEDCNDGTAHYVMDTIFSPAFHVAKVSEGEIPGEVDFAKFFRSGDQFQQNCGIENSRTDIHGHVAQDTLHRGIENTLTSINASCLGDIEVDTNEPATNFDEQHCSEILTIDTHISTCCNTDSEGAGLSSEVSAIYLAMKNSKLECVDEHGQDSMSIDVCVEDEDYEEFDDFDPYLFIRNLPDLSSVVPTFRRMLLPKQTRSCPPTSLVLDLDETLVHSTLEPCDDADFTFPVNFNLQEHTVYVRCRPHLRDFMDRVSRLFEIIIFTASQSIYAEQLLNVLDPKRKIFRHRVFRDSCVYVDGNYLKDLSVLGRDLAHVIIIDNSPQAFGFQVDNGIPIESWFDDRSDEELLLLLPFLESLVDVEDVRPLIAKKFKLREKVASATYPSSNPDRVHDF